MRRAAPVATVLTTLLALSGCGSDDTQDRIELTLESGQEPTVERVPVEAGTEVELVITSDEAGELHVHSEPEQELEYDEGTTTVTLTLEQPGVVDVERHDPEALVLQLEVG